MIFLDFVLDFLSLGIPDGPGREPTDRQLLASNRVRCGLRAATGRVLNIGTEWSEGICEITPRHLNFIPSMGVVGDRQIEVSGLRWANDEARARPRLCGRSSTTFIVSTNDGELYWTIVKRCAPKAVTLLALAPE